MNTINLVKKSSNPIRQHKMVKHNPIRVPLETVPTETRRLASNNTSGYTGVSYRYNDRLGEMRYVADWSVNNVRRRRTFKTIQEAIDFRAIQFNTHYTEHIRRMNSDEKYRPRCLRREIRENKILEIKRFVNL